MYQWNTIDKYWSVIDDIKQYIPPDPWEYASTDNNIVTNNIIALVALESQPN